MTNSLVLMTALVPSIGHKALVDFALKISDTVYVVVSTRSFEPVNGWNRVNSLIAEFDEHTELDDEGVVFIHHQDDDAPQNDDGTDAFWKYWKGVITSKTGIAKFDFVVSSEKYGNKLAEVMGAIHMPFDARRETTIARGSDIRKDIPRHWNQILPSFRASIPKLEYVFFGNESVGKTTIDKLVTEELLRRGIPTKFYPEWARQYLETVGSSPLTRQKMAAIIQGQKALQRMGGSGVNHLVSLYDTDLYTTTGYYEILNNRLDPEYSYDDHSLCQNEAAGFKMKRYFLLPDNFRMTPDPLRYGGDHRESDIKLWLDILRVNRLPYTAVPVGTVQQKSLFIANIVQQDVIDQFADIERFERE